MIWRGSCAWAMDARANDRPQKTMACPTSLWGGRSVFVACHLMRRMLFILQCLHQRTSHGALGRPERGKQSRTENHRRERQRDCERIGVSKIDADQIAAGNFHAVVELDRSQ